MVNHFSNSNILTDKFKLFEAVNNLNKMLANGSITSPIYRSTSEFTLETYCLHKNSQLIGFLARPNEGMWVVKNTSIERDSSIILIYDVAEYKQAMLSKVKRDLREKLQAIVGTNRCTVSDFTDSDEEEERKYAVRKSPLRGAAGQ